MKHTLTLLILLAVCPVLRAQKVDPQLVCVATTEFLTEVANSNFETQRGKLLGSDTSDTYEKFWWYESLKTFPLAKRITIQDESSFDILSRYVEIEMHTEFEDAPSAAMKDYNNQIRELFKACLGPNGFSLPAEKPTQQDIDAFWLAGAFYREDFAQFKLDLRKSIPDLPADAPDELIAEVEMDDEETDFGPMQVLYIRFYKE